MIGKHGRPIALLFAFLSAVPARADKQDKSCSEAAINDFKSRFERIQQRSSVLSIEDTIAVRRLEEQFCVRLVGCTFKDQGSVRFRANFESCLHDEAMEKFETDDRKE
jgi:hypothetical protein